MNLQVIQIGDYRVSESPDDILVTYALGSCIAIVVHDKVAQVGGLLHILLPDSRLDSNKAKANPLIFADTGIPILFQKAYSLGASKQRMRVCIAGGAQLNLSSSYFHVGAENIRATRHILQRANVPIHSESVGGNVARTIRLHVGTGQIAMQKTEATVLQTA